MTVKVKDDVVLVRTENGEVWLPKGGLYHTDARRTGVPLEEYADAILGEAPSGAVDQAILTREVEANMCELYRRCLRCPEPGAQGCHLFDSPGPVGLLRWTRAHLAACADA